MRFSTSPFAVAVFGGLGVAATLACSVGTGSGEVNGSLWVLDCEDGEDFGSPQAPRQFALNPRFFAGEPIEDIRRDNQRVTNRLLIRVQRDGQRIESNDSLLIDVSNVYEVARCIRGRTQGGLPDYDPQICDWSSGSPRVRVGRRDYLMASLAPFSTCTGTIGGTEAPVSVVATAISKPLAVNSTEPVNVILAEEPDPSKSLSWVQFERFGGAEQFDTPPEQRGRISPDFKVEYGSRILIPAFQLTLDDDRLWRAVERFERVPTAVIGGQVTGRVDFDMERGRAAQTFP